MDTTVLGAAIIIGMSRSSEGSRPFHETLDMPLPVLLIVVAAIAAAVATGCVGSLLG